MHPHRSRIVTLALVMLSTVRATAPAQDPAPRGAGVVTGHVTSALSPFASDISGRTARLTPPTALVGDTSTSSTHRTRNTILGAVIGLVAGAYIGGRIGAKAQPCGGHECGGPPLGQLGDGILGGLLGLVAGVVVGATVSDRT